MSKNTKKVWGAMHPPAHKKPPTIEPVYVDVEALWNKVGDEELQQKEQQLADAHAKKSQPTADTLKAIYDSLPGSSDTIVKSGKTSFLQALLTDQLFKKLLNEEVDFALSGEVEGKKLRGFLPSTPAPKKEVVFFCDNPLCKQHVEYLKITPHLYTHSPLNPYGDDGLGGSIKKLTRLKMVTKIQGITVVGYFCSICANAIDMMGHAEPDHE